MTESLQKPDHNYSWDEVESLYITTDISLNDLAIQTGKNVKTLYSHSSEGNWGEKRTKYRRQLLDKKREAALNASVKDKEQFDALTDRTCDVIVAMISAKVTDAYKAETKLKTSELESMTRTTRIAQEVKYRRHDIPAPKQPIEFEEKNAFSEYQKRLAEARFNVDYGVSAIKTGGGNGEGDEDDLVEVEMRPPEPSEN